MVRAAIYSLFFENEFLKKDFLFSLFSFGTVVEKRAWHYLDLVFANNGFDFDLCAKDGLTQRYKMTRNNISAIPRQSFTILNFDSYEEVAVFGILRLIHRLVPTLLHHQLLPTLNKPANLQLVLRSLLLQPRPRARLARILRQKAMALAGIALLLFFEQWVDAQALTLAGVACGRFGAVLLAGPVAT